MILSWKRKEVFAGSSMTDFWKTRSVLSNNHIPYDFRIVDRSVWGHSFGRTPSLTRLNLPFGNQEPDSMSYYIYVYKEDYETARYLLRK
jgi:hypothetical protein